MGSNHLALGLCCLLTFSSASLAESLENNAISAFDHKPLLDNTLLLNRPNTQNTVYIGRLYHEVSKPYDDHQSKHDYTQYQNFRGLRLGFQRKHSPHFASLYALETAKLDTITIENKDRNDMVYNLNLTESVRYIGLKSSIIASTNLQKGWQFYLGSGLFYDTYLKDSGDRDNYGVRYDFGLGYSWYHCQTMLRFSGDLTNNQPDSNTETAEVAIDFGYNF